MAIAFRPPEIRSEDAAVAPATATHPGMQYQAVTTTSASVPSQQQYHAAVLQHHQQYQHQTQFGVAVQGPLPSHATTGGYVILSPSSAVLQHHQGLWVSPLAATQQPQQMFAGFPPIYHNNPGTARAPQQHRLRVASNASPPQMRHPSQSPPRQNHRCVTTPCTTCDDVRRVYLLLSLMLSNVVYAALQGL